METANTQPVTLEAELPAEGGGMPGQEEPIQEGGEEVSNVESGEEARSDGARETQQLLIAPEVLSRANELLAQAKVIERLRGVDVLRMFSTDVKGREKVLSGEWDFTDLLEHSSAESEAPVMVRSANGSVGALDVHGMSASQFRSLNRMLEGGEVVRMGV